jgi:large subunit ribosomal protein L6
MSRIGRLPVELPQGVTAEVTGHEIKIVGPRGTMSQTYPRTIDVEVKDGEVLVTLKKVTKQGSSSFGTTRALIANIVKGVSEGWKKQMEIIGTGYKAEVQGDSLVLTVGYSHPIKIEAPEGITFKVEKSFITVEGNNKETVGQVSADIRSTRPPEPYKGKGIKYVGEIIRRKAGKAAKTAGGAA